MVEVKADALEESFEAFEREDEGVAALKVELDLLKAKIASGAIQGQRPALDGVKSQGANVFTEQYLRRGIEVGLEVKAIESSSDSIGGYAVPKEIDEQIDSTLNAISPIRSIANVVKVGSAGYRKLIASGGTPSGWVGFEADRRETALRTSPKSFRHPASATPIRRRASRCSTMRCSTSKPGLRRKLRPSLLGPKARHLSAEAVSTSRSVS
jgi:HK97 family phage major capsid protein